MTRMNAKANAFLAATKWAVLPMVLLSACAGPSIFVAYEGPRRDEAQVAQIFGKMDTGKVNAFKTGAIPGAPIVIEVHTLDGAPIDPSTSVELLPGTHRMRVWAVGIPNGEERHWVAAGDLEFTALADRRYQINALPSDAMPWSFTVSERFGATLLASSTSPVFDLDLPPLPVEAADWPVAAWGDHDHLSTVTHVPPGQSWKDGVRVLIRESTPIAPGTDAADAVAEYADAFSARGGVVHVSDEVDGSWTVDWAKTGQSEVGVGRLTRRGDRLYVYGFRSKDAASAVAEAEMWLAIFAGM